MSHAPFDLLAIGAHPDDVELSCGGWLAKVTAAGHRVAIVDLTRGERATNGSPERRAAEAAAAADHLGVSHRETLGLPDTGLRPDAQEQRDALIAALRRLRPHVVLAPWLEARHPDHRAAGELCETACFLAGVASVLPDAGAPHRPARLVFYPERHEVRPSFVVDVTDAYPAKQRAIAAYASQFDPRGAAPTLLNQAIGRDAFEIRDRYWGASAGVAFAEPYLIRGPLLIGDPLTMLRDAPSPALVPVT